jgi:hypothetical protein
LLAESAALFGELGMHLSPFAVGCDVILGWLDLNLGRYGGARTQAQIGLVQAQENGFRWHIAQWRMLLGFVELAEEAYLEAMGLFYESAASFREIEEQDWLGWAIAGLGYALRGVGDLCTAQTHLVEVLRTGVETPAFMPLLIALPAIALLMADRGERTRGVELYALASRYIYVANSRWFEDVAGRQIAAVAATLPPDIVAAAQERGRSRDLWETAAELLEELQRPGWRGPEQTLKKRGAEFNEPWPSC